jgi:hypothetical protein
MSKKHADSRKTPAEGERWDCRRCGQQMQRWQHAADWKPQPGKGWYLWWFECLNRNCRTTLVMPPGAYVKPGQDEPDGSGSGGGTPGNGDLDPFSYEQLLSAEDIQRLAHFRGI